jgi:hypothetical protein
VNYIIPKTKVWASVKADPGVSHLGPLHVSRQTLTSTISFWSHHLHRALMDFSVRAFPRASIISPMGLSTGRRFLHAGFRQVKRMALFGSWERMKPRLSGAVMVASKARRVRGSSCAALPSYFPETNATT